MPLNDAFDVGHLVAGYHCKLGRLGAHGLVLGPAHSDRFDAFSVGALAAEIDRGWGLVGEELLGDLGHALVHLPKEGFVGAKALLARSHRANSPAQRLTLQGLELAI